MLRVSGRCAHIWDPNSVYIETVPIHKRRALKSIVDTLRICMGLVLMYLQLILNPCANEWFQFQCKHFWHSKYVQSVLKFVTY